MGSVRVYGPSLLPEAQGSYQQMERTLVGIREPLNSRRLEPLANHPAEGRRWGWGPRKGPGRRKGGKSGGGGGAGAGKSPHATREPNVLAAKSTNKR